MKQKTGRKLLSFLLTLAMVVGLMPRMSLTAYAATDTYTNLIPKDSDTDLSAKQVNFNGYKWYIIADNSTAANAGSVTLFAAEKIGTSQFYTSKKEATAQSYNGSTVKAYLDSLTTGEGSFAAFADAIIPTNLTTYKFNSSEVYETTENAKLYLLSVSEASELPTNVRKSSTYWWLRSPGTYDQYDKEYYAAVVSYATGEVDKNGYWVTITYGVRPALKLDLSKVTFDSTSKTFSLKSVASVTSGETTTEYAAFSEALNAWTDGSTLTLLADAEITKTINVSGTKTLDLNGYGIKATGTGYSVITVGSGANLTLNDTGSDTTGFITGGVASFGGGININGGTVKMNGGNLTGNTASGSGSSGRGGGVYVINGSFELRDGIIEGNKATNGGGVTIGSSGTFTMSGGVIQYNDGLSGGVLLTQAKDFTISGGAIQYNAGSAFGGIGIDGNLTIQMSGAPVIKGNVVFSDTNGKITKTDSGYTLAEGGTPSDVRQLNKQLIININSALTSGAAIGISQPYTFTQTDAFTTGFKTYHSGNEATEFFFSNDAGTVIAKDANGELIIADACTVTFNANGHGTEPASATVASGSVITAPTAPTADGYTFGGWYKEQGCTNEWNFASDTVTAATILYAKWTPVAATAPTINSVTGAVLTVGYTEGSVSVSATVATDTTYNSLTYQWYSNTTNSNSNGTEISGATSASYAVPTGKAAGVTEYYYCVVTATRTDNSQTATATSDVATVTVNEKGTQTITASDVAVTYGDADKKVEAATDGNGAISYAVKDGSAEYIDVDASTGALTIKKAGTATVVVTAAETSTYAQATKEVTVTINKANAVAATVTANNRTYDRTDKPLVTVDNSTLAGGKMQYALGNETEATQPYTTSIPTATDAGTYYVWYKVVGNENYNDSKPDVVTVTIKPSVTVTFDSNGGSKVDSQMFEKGGKAEEPEKPVNGKLTFIGWFVDPTIETLYDIDNDRVNSFDFSSSVEKDTKLTAVWTAYAKVNTIGTGKVNFAYEGEEKDDEYDDSIILSAIQGMADTFILTAKADEGSRFVKWQKVIEEGETVEDSTFEDYSEDEEITIKITEPISLVAVFEAVDEDDKEYSSYESDTEWTKGSGMTFKAGAKGNKDDEDTLDHFTGLKGDGKLIDTKYYTAKKGSVKIELAPEYLETLEAGKHILTFMFDDADDLDIEFTVLAEEAGDDTEEETTEDATDETSEEGSTDETEKETTEETEEASEDRTEETEEASEDKTEETEENSEDKTEEIEETSEDNTTEDSEGVSEDVSEDSSSVDESTENTAKDAEIEVDDNTGTTEAKGDSSAKTGDNAPLLLVFLIMIDSALALNFVFLKKRKSGNNK